MPSITNSILSTAQLTGWPLVQMCDMCLVHVKIYYYASLYVTYVYVLPYLMYSSAVPTTLCDVSLYNGAKIWRRPTIAHIYNVHYRMDH